MHTLSATTFEEELPEIGEETLHALVVLRLRGSTNVGSTALNVLAGHAVMISTPGTQGLSLLSPARVGKAGVLSFSYSATDVLG